jgi:hypothetical protein
MTHQQHNYCFDLIGLYPLFAKRAIEVGNGKKCCLRFFDSNLRETGTRKKEARRKTGNFKEKRLFKMERTKKCDGGEKKRMR